MALRHHLPRTSREDIWNPSIEQLLDLSLDRMRNITSSNPQKPLPRLFPTAEKMRGEFFTAGDWSEFGDLEAEHGRLTYILSRHPERGPPSTCEDIMRDLLRQKSVLVGWKTARQALRRESRTTLERTLPRQSGGRLSLSRDFTTKSDYLAVPEDYEFSEATSRMGQRLWNRSLEEMAAELANSSAPTNRIEFLQIHSYLKDPICGLEADFEDQNRLLTHLLTEFFEEEADRPVGYSALHLADLEKVAAQAARESSYLANPLVDRIFLVHFHGHHQLPYANIELHSLARAEFSVPSHVLEVVEEMLQAALANDGLACPLVPVLVAACPSFSDPRQSLTVIIDGNHRATASVLLRFLATSLDTLEPIADSSASGQEHRADVSQQLTEYCTSHRLGKKWHLDLSDVLQELLHGPRRRRFHNLVLANAELVRKFAPVQCIPALVVQEQDFLTICKQRSQRKHGPVLLHPFHQTLFNDDTLPFALPQKAGQTHGRPEGFRLLPLTPFGTGAQDKMAGVGGTMAFHAKLRKSMNGVAPPDEVPNQGC